MKQKATLAVLVLLSAVTLTWTLSPPGPTAPSTAAPVSAPAPATRPVPIPPPEARESLVYRRPSPEVVEELSRNPETAKRLREHEKQLAATQRFSDAVDEGNFDAEDLNRSVVSFFKTMELEPVLDEESMILGLEIQHIYSTSPLRETSIVAGDRITHINDEALRDPADLPALLEGLERDMTLCVDRDGRHHCERISLD